MTNKDDYSIVYEWPPHRQSWHPVLDAIIGNWSIAGLLHYASGPRLAAATTVTLRPWAIRNPNEPVAGTASCSNYNPAGLTSRYLNPAAFSTASAFTLGDSLVIDGLNGCGIVRENLSVFKTLHLNGRTIKIGAEANNLFNRHSWRRQLRTVHERDPGARCSDANEYPLLIVLSGE